MAVKNELDTLLNTLSELAQVTPEEATAMPLGVYTSDELLRRELDCIFSTQWICAGREDSIVRAGDYITYHIGNQPIVIMRQQDNSVRAFANVCRHRMMQLLDGSGSCTQKLIVCPYHAWSYGIDGQLVAAPHMDSRLNFNKANYSLHEIRLEIWHGWLYVTLDNSLPGVAETLADLTTLLDHYQMQHYVQIDQQDHIWDTNWKLLTENFMEGYHLPVAHRATVGANFPVEETRFSESSPNAAFTYQYFSKTDDATVGTAHPANTVLHGEQRYTSIMPTVFPSHMFVLAPDHLWYLSLQPQGTSQVHIRYGLALAPEVLEHCEDPAQYKDSVSAFLDRVNAEDRTVVEGIFKGAQAPLSTPGPLCWLERELHEFTQYLARRLCS